jgi:putative protease
MESRPGLVMPIRATERRSPGPPRSRPELLAPAGDEECLRAAVANGADAVYFGLEDFNARRRARNFTLEGLPAIVADLHAHNVKGYVAFNTLVFPDELERAAAFVGGIIGAGADALIVQDLGLAALVHRMAPDFPIHASTQTSQTHAAGFGVLEGLGVRRVILARELSLEEIGSIAGQTPLELEAFVHGALCISYSGQCLASEWLWGRSGNRGLCSQACRLPGELLVDGVPQPSPEGDHLLSPHDLAAWSRLPDLLAAGVSGFKIEGRLKNAEYVACVTRIYREALDAAMAGRPFSLSGERRQELDQCFSRGYTLGFLDGPRHQELIGAKSPRSRGQVVGTAVRRTAGGIVVRLQGPAGSASLKPGDGIVFDDGGPQDLEQGGRIYSIRPADRAGTGRSAGGAPAGQVVELGFGRQDVDLARVPVPSTVLKTDDPAVARRILGTMRRDRVARPVAVFARVFASAGQPLRLVLADDAGHEAVAESDGPLAAAERHPLTIELLREQLSRMGDTPLSLESAELLGPEGPVEMLPVMAPKSVLNHLRRTAAQRLLELREAAGRCRVIAPDALAVLRSEPAGRPDGVNAPPQLHVLTRSLGQFEAMLDFADSQSAIGTVWGDFADASDWGTARALARGRRGEFALAVPRILHPGQEQLLEVMADLAPDTLLVRNLAAAVFFRERLPAATLVGDFSLNAVNELTAGVLAGAGIRRITTGYDLGLPQLEEMARRADHLELETILHAHVPLFVTAYCPAAACLSRGNRCDECGRPCKRHEFRYRDRNGLEHPVRFDITGRMTIFSPSPQSLAAARPPRQAIEIHHWRIELLDEAANEASALASLYLRLIAGEDSARAELRRRWPRLVGGTFDHA